MFVWSYSFVYESRRSLARHEYLQGGQQEFFIIVFLSIRYQTLISDIDTFILTLFIVSLDFKSKVIQILFVKAVFLWFPMNTSYNVNQQLENTFPTR